MEPNSQAQYKIADQIEFYKLRPGKDDDLTRDITSMDWSKEGQYLATTNFYKKAAVWSTADRSLLWEKVAHEEEVGIGRLSPSGKKFLTSGLDGKILLYETKTGKVIVTYDQEPGIYPYETPAQILTSHRFVHGCIMDQ